MATSERDVIDFSTLERELQGAIESERRHKRENKAKLSAIGQKVATYEQFRDLVLACHLKPMGKNDREGGCRKPPWNPVTPSNQ
uniref:Dynein attachment factor N-terminal domain-containing protein n=1 Tax=Mola mola TaxID=94237 RepID=A0A3Q4ACK2_MOLML